VANRLPSMHEYLQSTPVRVLYPRSRERSRAEISTAVRRRANVYPRALPDIDDSQPTDGTRRTEEANLSNRIGRVCAPDAPFVGAGARMYSRLVRRQQRDGHDTGHTYSTLAGRELAGFKRPRFSVYSRSLGFLAVAGLVVGLDMLLP